MLFNMLAQARVATDRAYARFEAFFTDRPTWWLAGQFALGAYLLGRVLYRAIAFSMGDGDRHAVAGFVAMIGMYLMFEAASVLKRRWQSGGA